MFKIDNYEKYFEDNNIDVFDVECIPDILERGVSFGDYEQFLRFVIKKEIKTVFCEHLYKNVDDYLIIEENLKEDGKRFLNKFFDIIGENVNEYNNQLRNVDFSEPFGVILSCLFEKHFFYVCYTRDFIVNDNVLLYPEEKLNEIYHIKEIEILNKKADIENRIIELKEELKEEILCDNKFLKCTNAHLRYVYAHELVPKLKKKYALLKDLWSESNGIVRYAAVDFVDIIWKEHKENQKSKKE